MPMLLPKVTENGKCTIGISVAFMFLIMSSSLTRFLFCFLFTVAYVACSLPCFLRLPLAPP